MASPAWTVKTSRDRPGAAAKQSNAARHLHSVKNFAGSDTMSIFGKIMSAIFGTKADASTPGSTTTTAGGPAPSTGSSAAPAAAVDVAPILDKAVAAKKEKLEWRTSIVDLMKALDIDSSLTARKELAKELNYTGDTNGSATMNIWLHKQVLIKQQVL